MTEIPIFHLLRMQPKDLYEVEEMHYSNVFFECFLTILTFLCKVNVK